MTQDTLIRSVARTGTLLAWMAAVSISVPAAADPPVAAPLAETAITKTTAPTVSETLRSKRLREIDDQLARDKKRITELLSQPPSPEATPGRVDPELGQIAERMPRLQAERRLWIEDPEVAARAELVPVAP